MRLGFHTLDVFTRTSFTGNPLAVVLDAGGLTDRQMQSIAREFNLSETVFVSPPHDPANTARMRIFMPRGELPFAGHPTIGAAVVLASLDATGSPETDRQIRLEEPIGLVAVTVTCADGLWHGTLSGAVMPSAVGTVPPSEKLAVAIGLTKDAIGFGNHRPGIFDAGVPYLFIPVRDLRALGSTRVVEPHWSEMTTACGADGAYIYTAGDGDLDWRARYYEPQAGIPEDPATGSAVAALPGQLNAAQALPNGRHSWKVGQGHEMGRPSVISLTAYLENGRFSHIEVGGHAVLISSGDITV